MASRSRTFALTLAVVTAVAVGGCTSQDDDRAAPTPQGTAAACTKQNMPTRTPGTLTIATDQPAAGPWFRDNKPDNGEGFEAAVAYAVAEQLGYAPTDVTWTRITSDAAIAPGPKDFDFAIDQFSITEARKQSVEFSAPYYLVRQTVVALKASKLAGKTTLAELRNASLGAQAGTTSHQAITDVIKPTRKPRVFTNTDDAKKALRNGQLDGLVVDLPTAFSLTGTELTGATVVGQLPQVGAPEAFGLLLDKNSPLAACVTGAVGTLSQAGTLRQLEQKWLAQAAGAPELT